VSSLRSTTEGPKISRSSKDDLAMETPELLIQIKKEIDDLKKLIRQTSFGPAVSDKWLPRARVMEFLNYGNTQMAEFEKN
jgi:hypothetical protein